MNLTISKEDFETVLYVATHKNSQVYDGVLPVLEQSQQRCGDNILGTAGAAAVESDERLKKEVVSYICLDAFLKVFRQLDLVLTSTGFGVVSNNTTAPASRDRVNALEAQLRIERLRSVAVLLGDLTKVTGWGSEQVASQNIRYVMWNVTQLERMADRSIDVDQWMAAQQGIIETDIMLRRKVSDALLEKVMTKIRTFSPDMKWWDVIHLMEEITFLHLWHSPMELERMNNLVNVLEADPETFSSYINSDAYKVNHYDKFKNDKSNTAFFFVG